jgi:hypothetical protein
MLKLRDTFSVGPGGGGGGSPPGESAMSWIFLEKRSRR